MIFRKQVHAFAWTYRHLTVRMAVFEIDVISKYLNDDSICFDVGAHGGSWSRGLARKVPKGHVYSFEALPYYADVLSMTMRLLRQNRVTVVNRTIAETSGDVEIVRQDGDGTTLTGKTHVAAQGERTQETVSTTAISLDSFWQDLGNQQIDFIKCDIEGFELFALRGARGLIEQCRPVFYNELNAEWCERYGYTPSDVFSFFTEREYAPFYIEGNSDLVSVDEAQHVNRDVLFVPQERVQL